MQQNDSWRTLHRQDDASEMRLVVARELPDGSIEVEERTDGELTLLTYGTLTCVRVVKVASEDVEALVWALGPTDASALDALEGLFAGEASYLSDLQDVLDAGGVKYAFSMACGNDFALRRHASQRA